MRIAVPVVLCVWMNISYGQDTVLLCASGVVEPKGEERSLHFPIAGTVGKMNAGEGKVVSAGDVIAELENTEEKAQVALSKVAVERARAILEKLKNGGRQEERAIADAEVARAESHLEKLENGARKEDRLQAEARLARWKAETRMHERTLKRLRNLRNGGVEAATLEEVENAEDKLDIARAGLAEAKAYYELTCLPARKEDIESAKAECAIQRGRAAMVKGKAREEDLAVARADVATAEAQIEIARARLEKTLLRAPTDGVVLKVFLEDGERAVPMDTTPVLTMGDTSKLMIRAEVDENDVAKVHADHRVYAKARAFGDKRFSGTVVRVGHSMGRKRLFTDSPREKIDTRVLEVMIELDRTPDIPVGFRMDVYFLGERKGEKPK